jgi:hypothetical protein
LSFNFSVLASEFEFAITLCEDLDVVAGEPIGWTNIANGRVESHGIVVIDETLDEPSGILLGRRAARTEAISFETLVPAFDFPVARVSPTKVRKVPQILANWA